MTQLTCIIVDDEPLGLRLLRSKLQKHSDLNIIAECKNGKEAIAATTALTPDLLFLDIQMPGIDGFGVIKKIQADIMPLVIFVTAFEQYALHAFDIHAVDYILKPIDQTHIERAIIRAKARLAQESQLNQDQSTAQLANKSRLINALDSIGDHQHQQNRQDNSELNSNNIESNDADINNTINDFSHQANHSQLDNVASIPLDKKIIIKDRDGLTLLKQPDIEWIDAAGDYTCLHAAGVTHIKRCTLKDLLNDLDPNMFKRVHRSTIVNLNYIKKVIPHTKGEYFLQLGEFDQIKVSRNYKDAIKDYLVNG